MRIHRVDFSGAILERGFWLYAWRIAAGAEEVYYIGRTGDSSSRYAASPFARLGQHLDVRPSAQGNMLLRQIRKAGLDPLKCEFNLVAFGPLFQEQTTLEAHRKYRDLIAPLETALAEFMRERGFRVLGSHGSKGVPDPELLHAVERAFDAEFPPNAVKSLREPGRLQDLLAATPRLPQPLTVDPHFTPCQVRDGDELYPNGIFVFNITAMLDFLESNPTEVPLTEVAVEEFSRNRCLLDPSEIESFDVSRPVVLAEISPGHYNLIDGNHRMEKARRLRMDTMMAYKVPQAVHVRFLTSREAYVAYVEYWNGKLDHEAISVQIDVTDDPVS